MKLIPLLMLLSLPAMAEFKFPSGLDSIYNRDTRQLISRKGLETTPQIKNFAKSVALIFNSDDLITEQAQELIFANLLQDVPPVGMNICPDELFASHHAYRSACSGFLVGPDLMATAGHCFESQYACDNQLIAFDVDAESEIPRGFATNDKNIYHCKKIIAQIHDENSLQDYAIIKLDRKSERAPLKLRTTGKLSTTDKVYLIGHPLGLPLMYSPAARISDNSNTVFFKSQINSFRGNSGSPVFNAKTNLVEGILVRGQEDLVFDQANQCQRYQVYKSTDPAQQVTGEDATRIKNILPFIKNSNNK